MKSIKKDLNGNIISGTTSILILSIFIIVIMLISVMSYLNTENIHSISNDNFRYIVEDYNKNIEILAYDSIKELSQKIIKSKTKSENSPNDIKKILNKKLNEKNKEYKNRYNISINSKVVSVENGDSPIYIKIKVKIYAEKHDEKFNEIVESKTSIIGLNDPLPILICGNHPSFCYNNSRIMYGYSLTEYLNKKD